MNPTKKILLIQTGFLGDVVLSTPVFTALLEYFPDAEITLLTTPGARSLVENHPQIRQIITYDKRGKDSGLSGLLRICQRLRSEKFDSVFSLHKSHRTAFLVWCLGVRPSYGFREAACSWVYSKRASRKEYAHEVQRNLAILKPLGYDPASSDLKLSLGISAEDSEVASALIAELPPRRIGIAPGSVWATKRWTTNGFAAVAQHFLQHGFGIVLLGGPDDAQSAQQILDLLGPQKAVVNAVGRCSLSQSAAIIAKLDALVSNDSAPLHIASATQCPVVAIFCATIPEFGFGPWSVASEIVEVAGLECRPCGSHGGMTCPTGTHACQLGVAPGQVIAAVSRLLSEQGRTNG